VTPEILATLLADPERASALPRADLPELLGQLERLRATLWAALSIPATNGAYVVDHTSGAQATGQDHLLTVQELAVALSVDERWIYRRASTWPFTRRLSDRTLRFSERGLARWLEKQR
jgi:hypothetical protein